MTVSLRGCSYYRGSLPRGNYICGALRPISNHADSQIFARSFVNRIISLGEVERPILFVHAGRQRKFPVNSLFPGHNLHILGRIRRFLDRIRKFPVNFAVLVTQDEEAGRDQPISFNSVGRGTHQPWSALIVSRRVILADDHTDLDGGIGA
jgi:hypothetical protein